MSQPITRMRLKAIIFGIAAMKTVSAPVIDVIKVQVLPMLKAVQGLIV
jgi:hypothetical protein